MRRFLLFLLVFVPLLSWCQSQDSKYRQYEFAIYLIGNGLKEDALVLDSLLDDDGDSISFVKGYINYSAKSLQAAIGSFAQVNNNSSFYTESLFWNSLSHAHLGDYLGAEKVLAASADLDGRYANLRWHELAGISLLRRDLQAFDSLFGLIDTTDYRLELETRDLFRVRTAIEAHKNRQPWVAATLSALLPGLGKVYAGNLGEGISAFLLTGSLVSVTAENWYREGFRNWKTLLFGTAAAVFYIGNIYGSAVTVKVACDRYNNDTDVQILYDIHIPIRNSFRH